jgi:hypothetical protein
MTCNRIILRHLVFTGAQREKAQLEFSDGLNLVYGASNTGKSFALKAIDFMLGGTEQLPDIEERAGYDKVLLGFTITGVNDFTLARAVNGGPYRLHTGLVTVDDPLAKIQVLAPTAKTKSKNNLPRFLLEHLGFSEKKLAKTVFGEKENLSFRELSIFSLVDEISIQSERSPVNSDLGPVKETKEKSLFRLLVTGSDDAAVIAVANEKTFATSKATRIEVVQELLDRVDARLGADFSERTQLPLQFERLNESLNKIQSEYTAAQQSVRGLISEKRELTIEIPTISQRSDEIEVHLQRFSQLDLIYKSDIARLDSLEEAGFLFTSEHLHSCYVCGAPPEAQINIESENLDAVRNAALAEIEKIEKHRADLSLTVNQLNIEFAEINNRLPLLEKRLSSVENSIELASPKIIEAKNSLDEILSARSHVQEGMILLTQSEQYSQKLREYAELKKPSKEDRPNLSPPSLATHEFALTVGKVLKAWEFPGDISVSFDEKTYDLKIDGKLRTNNGKGVRAVTHAAFKVALLVFCRERNLSHPGFVVLDTPLLTYRDPMKNLKAGQLADDEKRIAESSLKSKFFEYLSSISTLGQFIILENIDPPDEVADIAHVETFSGASSIDRIGFFPKHI